MCFYFVFVVHVKNPHCGIIKADMIFGGSNKNMKGDTETFILFVRSSIFPITSGPQRGGHKHGRLIGLYMSQIHS